MQADRPEGQRVEALTRGLTVLRKLVDAGRPLSATAIAAEMGLHQSSVSRLLATLADIGFVRKTAAGFSPDFGVLSLASASEQFPLVNRPRAAMQRIGEQAGGLNVSLGMFWRNQMIYFLRRLASGEMIDFWWSTYPIQVSAPGMRLLLDQPESEALDTLRASRARHGWLGNQDVLPGTEEGVLAAAREQTEHDVLVLRHWHHRGQVGAAIPIHAQEAYPVALALSGPGERADDATLRIWLHEFRREVEASLRTDLSTWHAHDA